MGIRIELAIVVDEKLKVIKSDYMKEEIETITELVKAAEEYKKHFRTTNPHITCNVFTTAKLALTV